MATFRLRVPVQAIQYTYQETEKAVAELITSTGRHSSHDNSRGYLHVYNDGLDLHIENGSWVVVLDKEVLALSSTAFNRLFTPVR